VKDELEFILKQLEGPLGFIGELQNEVIEEKEEENPDEEEGGD
jgi:hypothetical protein